MKHGTRYAAVETGCTCAECATWQASRDPRRQWYRQDVDGSRWSTANLAWFAGLFEGEGSVATTGRHCQLSLTISMTDRDVIERCARMTGTGYVTGPYEDRRGANRMPLFHWKVSARSAYALAVAIYGNLGRRRQCQIREAIRRWLVYQRPEHWRVREPDRSVRSLTFQGRTKTVRAWADEIGISRNSLYWRLSKGWPLADALTSGSRQGQRVT